MIFIYFFHHFVNQCLIKKIDVQQSNQKCPECDATLTRQEVKDLNLAWEKSPFRVDIENVLELKLKNKNNLNSNEINSAKGEFYVILLNGTKLNFKLENIKTVEALKEAIKKQTNIENGKQKLIHKGVELEVCYYVNQLNFFLDLCDNKKNFFFYIIIDFFKYKN